MLMMLIFQSLTWRDVRDCPTFWPRTNLPPAVAVVVELLVVEVVVLEEECGVAACPEQCRRCSLTAAP